MRVLHTSDWHVGRMFHGRDLLADQESVLCGLADLVADERVDVVVVSGDLYDRAVPSGEAVSACTRILKTIRAAGAQLVVTPGNHDSAPRLGAFGEFTAAGTCSTPPTAMVRSEAQAAPPVTNACASTTERVPPGRVARSARTRRIASVSTPACPRASGVPSACRAGSGSR